MVDAGIKLVTIASDVPATPRSTYVGLDNRVAGRTAALLMGRLLRGLAGNIAIVTGSRSYRGHEEREMGFRAVLGEDFPRAFGEHLASTSTRMAKRAMPRR